MISNEIKADAQVFDLILKAYGMDAIELKQRHHLDEVIITAGSNGGDTVIVPEQS